MTERTAQRRPAADTGATAEFERLYRANVDAVTAYFARRLLTELALLPERDRAVVELVDIAGLRPNEAAAALGLPPGTARMRLMRARARLRKEALRTTTNQIKGDTR